MFTTIFWRTCVSMLPVRYTAWRAPFPRWPCLRAVRKCTRRFMILQMILRRNWNVTRQNSPWSSDSSRISSCSSWSMAMRDPRQNPLKTIQRTIEWRGINKTTQIFGGEYRQKNQRRWPFARFAVGMSALFALRLIWISAWALGQRLVQQPRQPGLCRVRLGCYHTDLVGDGQQYSKQKSRGFCKKRNGFHIPWVRRRDCQLWVATKYSIKNFMFLNMEKAE